MGRNLIVVEELQLHSEDPLRNIFRKDIRILSEELEEEKQCHLPQKVQYVLFSSAHKTVSRIYHNLEPV